MSALAWKLIIAEAFKRFGKRIAIKVWNWEVERAKQRERKRNEEALKSANDNTGK